MACITIKNITFHAPHGVFEEERKKGNTFEVDLFLWAALDRAGRSDQLNDTLDYQKAVKVVENIMNGEPVNLIETLLYRTGEALLDAFPQATRIEVAIRKRQPPMSPSCEYTEVRAQWPLLS